MLHRFQPKIISFRITQNREEIEVINASPVTEVWIKEYNTDHPHQGLGYYSLLSYKENLTACLVLILGGHYIHALVSSQISRLSPLVKHIPHLMGKILEIEWLLDEMNTRLQHPMVTDHIRGIS